MKIKEVAKKYNRHEMEFQYRADGRIEWVCEHGVGHTIYSPNDNYVHGCCSCCFYITYKQVEGFTKYWINREGNLYNSEIKRCMKPHEKDGYLFVQLNENGKRLYRSMHRLVAESFIDNPEGKRCVNHKDFNRKNNYYTNLEWVTDSENNQYSYDNDRRPDQWKIAQNNERKACKLTNEDIINIFYFKNKGSKVKDLAKRYGVHRETISRILRRETYKHVFINKKLFQENTGG